MQTWKSNSDMVHQFSKSVDYEVYDCWKALELLRFCGRVIYNSANGRKGAHIESFTPIQGYGAFPLAGRLSADKKQAYKHAIESLAKYKFMMFGYHAAMWVHLNKIDG
ncbi:MAG TPA: hypothetical protein VMW01_00865 [Williamwhitmania sp.]|nr:hypothetical protein [Williamwhitmania sp.]